MNLVIAHQVEGRTRLKLAGVPVTKGDVGTFIDRLSAMPDIEGVDFRPHTGSVVLEHPYIPVSALGEVLARAGGVIIAGSRSPAPAPSGLNSVRSGLDTMDGLLSRMTAGGLDMRTLTFAVLVALAVRQILNGQVMVPALSLLTWATELLPRSVAAQDEHIDAVDE